MEELAETPTLTISDTPEDEGKIAGDLIDGCQKYLAKNRDGILTVSVYESPGVRQKEMLKVAYSVTLRKSENSITSLVIATDTTEDNMTRVKKMTGMENWPKGRQIQIMETTFSGEFPNVKSSHSLEEYFEEDVKLAREITEN